MSDDCLFCKIIQGVIPSKKVYEDDDVFAFHDINPEAPVHILVLPKKHMSGVAAMAADDCLLVGKVMYAAKKIADDLAVQEGSYRLVINNGALASQSVFHLHVHLLADRRMQWPPG